MIGSRLEQHFIPNCTHALCICVCMRVCMARRQVYKQEHLRDSDRQVFWCELDIRCLCFDEQCLDEQC